MSKKCMLFEKKDEEKVLAEFGITSQTLGNNIQAVKEWLKKQSYLPEIHDDNVIKSFLSYGKFSVEETKGILDFYYTFRSTFPALFKHPSDSEMKRVADIFYFIPLPYQTEDLKTILYAKIKDADPNHFDWNCIIAHMLNVHDLMIAEGFIGFTIAIIDLSGIKMAHFSLVDISILKKSQTLMQKVFRKNFKGAYIINTPPGWDAFFKIILPVINNKKIKIVVDPDSSICFNLFSKKLLPIEAGGEGVSLEEMQKIVKEKFMEYKTYFDHLQSIKLDERFRGGPSTDSEIFSGLQGHFQKLEID
ncbi:uncharacterized protein LOC108742811 [Agrilus planipennis]|uniref:Uncharacterized protein LOC108742811 n=1 Tax=Agrilus planipennis TaxID=224129 RepID=A0A1W4XLI4_AGRPL|nr:uncharacterized protein LOC108742811 [Agrilus planipennis]